MNDFIDKIIPIPEVKEYGLTFLAKCLSGENRDEGFYIWTGTGGNGKSKIIECETIRENNGIACSSRNSNLNKTQMKIASKIFYYLKNF